MNSRRLARLMGIICDVKGYPRRSPDEVCRRLRISRRRLYKDRDSLAAMGIGFHHSHKTGGFVLDREPTFNVIGMSLADFFALVLAVRQLTRANDFALAGLRTIIGQLSESLRGLFEGALDQVVIADGFGCALEALHALLQAIAEDRRVVLVMDSLTERRNNA